VGQRRAVVMSGSSSMATRLLTAERPGGNRGATQAPETHRNRDAQEPARTYR
jgi:hypothetical protein